MAITSEFMTHLIVEILLLRMTFIRHQCSLAIDQRRVKVFVLIQFDELEEKFCLLLCESFDFSLARAILRIKHA